MPRSEHAIPYPRFVTDIWQHPLLTPSTLQHRQNTHSLVSSFFQRYEQKIPRADIVAAVPFGSTIWITGEESDHDMVVFCRTDETAKSIDTTIRGVGYRRARNRQSSEAGKTHPDVLSFRTLSVSNLGKALSSEHTQSYLATLYLTPDEFIWGDPNEVAQLRVSVLQAVVMYGKQQEFYRSMQTIFENNIKNWPYLDNHLLERFESTLEARAEQFAQSFPESDRAQYKAKYIAAFHKAHENFQLPPFDEIYTTLMASHGRLSLAAQASNIQTHYAS